MDFKIKQSTPEGTNVSDGSGNQIIKLFSSLLFIGTLLLFLIILFDKGAVMVAESII